MPSPSIVPSRLALLGILALLLGSCGTPTSTQPEAPQVAPVGRKSPAEAREILDERWEAIYLKGSKIGYGHTVRERIKTSAGPKLRTTAMQILTLMRYEQSSVQTIETIWEETEKGKPLLARSDLSGGSSLQTVGEFGDGTMTLTTFTQGKRTKEVLDWNEELLGYFGLEDSLRKQPMQAGEKRRVLWLQPVVNKPTEDQLEAIAEELVAMPDGSRKQLLRIKSVATLAGRTIESTLWTDDQGTLWRTLQAPAQEVYRTTEEVAKAEGAAAPVDLGLSTIVKINKPLESAHATKQVAYRARLKEKDPAKVFPTCGSQLVKSMDDRTAEITVRRITADSDKVENIAPATLEDSAPNSFVQSDDVRVRRMAKELVGQEQDQVAIAVALEKGVKEKVREKNFSQAFATAADVAQQLEGDCTEHAVLLAALLRTQKIPARVAAGLVYYPPQQGFAYHMWTEAWLNDRWVPLDATLGRGGIGGGHLKLFDSNLAGSAAFIDFLSIVDVLDQLELEIIDVQ